MQTLNLLGFNLVYAFIATFPSLMPAAAVIFIAVGFTLNATDRHAEMAFKPEPRLAEITRRLPACRWNPSS